MRYENVNDYASRKVVMKIKLSALTEFRLLLVDSQHRICNLTGYFASHKPLTLRLHLQQ